MADDGQNALVPRLNVGGSVQAIVPQSFEDAWRIAGALARSGMCPRGMDTQEQALVAIMAGAEIGLAPFQAVQSFAVINGRPSLWGDGMLAVVRKFGVKVDERLENDGEKMVAVCVVKRPDTGETITRFFSVEMAKKAGLWGKQGPWQQYPQRMLQMRARAWALRDGCADMLRGMKMAEEVQDYVDVTRDEPVIDPLDQRPPEEIAEARAAMSEEGAFLGGEPAKLASAHRAANMRACQSVDDLDKEWKSIARMYGPKGKHRMSENAFSGLEFIYEQERVRLAGSDVLIPWFTSFIDGCEHAHALEEWWESADTVTRFNKLSEGAQATVSAAYEAQAETLAAKAEAERNVERARQAEAFPGDRVDG